MTPKSFDHDDLGIDLDHAKSLPECHGCRKKSDGAVTLVNKYETTVLCGTHYDEWMKRFPRPSAAAFARELREGKYKACWEAKLEE